MSCLILAQSPSPAHPPACAHPAAEEDRQAHDGTHLGNKSTAHVSCQESKGESAAVDVCSVHPAGNTLRTARYRAVSQVLSARAEVHWINKGRKGGWESFYLFRRCSCCLSSFQIGAVPFPHQRPGMAVTPVLLVLLPSLSPHSLLFFDLVGINVPSIIKHFPVNAKKLPTTP